MSIQIIPIKIGAAVILVGDAPTNNINDLITTNIDQGASPSGYTATETELVVDDASVIAPNVFETASGSTIGDPPTIDVIQVIRTGEIMFCFSRTDSTETINVVRGFGRYWKKYSTSATQWNTAINDDDELQLMGSLVFPDTSSAIVTQDDVQLEVSYDTVTVSDNQEGNQESYLSASSTVTLTATLPKSIEASAQRILGYQSLTDGASPSKYFTEPGNWPVGSQLAAKFFVIMPNSVFYNLSGNTVSVGGANHVDLKDIYFIPRGNINPNEMMTWSNSNQSNLPLTVTGQKDPVVCKTCHHGGTSDMCRITETVS